MDKVLHRRKFQIFLKSKMNLKAKFSYINIPGKNFTSYISLENAYTTIINIIGIVILENLNV